MIVVCLPVADRRGSAGLPSRSAKMTYRVHGVIDKAHREAARRVSNRTLT